MSEFSGATAPTRRGRRKGNYDPRPTSTVASCAPGPIALQQSVEELALAVQKARDGVLQELNRASSNAAELQNVARQRFEEDLRSLGDAAQQISSRIFGFQGGKPADSDPESADDAEYESDGDVPVNVRVRKPENGADGYLGGLHDAVGARVGRESGRPKRDRAADDFNSSYNREGPGPSGREVLLQAQVSRLQTELAAATAERDRALSAAEQLRKALDGLTGKHEELQGRYAQLLGGDSPASPAGARGKRGGGGGGGGGGRDDAFSDGALDPDEDGYHLDSVSVVLDASRGVPSGAAAHDSGYAAAVARLEERVKSLGRQLAAEREHRERLEKDLADPFRAPPQSSTQSQVAAAVAAAADQQARGEAAASGAGAGKGPARMLEPPALLRLMCQIAVLDNSDVTKSLKALTALGSLSSGGASARALLAAGAAGAAADTMVRHQGSLECIREGLAALYLLSGGIPSPQGGSGGGGGGGEQDVRLRPEDRARREQMAYECALQCHPSKVLVMVGTKWAANPQVAAAWGHTVASIGRVELAARLLLEQGVVGCLAAAVSRFSSGASDGGPAQAAASLGALQACCVALGALASSGRAVRVAVTRGRGLEALQVAMSLNATVDRAMRSAFPSLEPWLAGREKHGLRETLASSVRCGLERPTALKAEDLWKATATAAAVTKAQQRGGQSWSGWDGGAPPRRLAGTEGPLDALTEVDESEARGGAGAGPGPARGGWGGGPESPRAAPQSSRGGAQEGHAQARLPQQQGQLGRGPPAENAAADQATTVVGGESAAGPGPASVDARRQQGGPLSARSQAEPPAASAASASAAGQGQGQSRPAARAAAGHANGNANGPSSFSAQSFASASQASAPAAQPAAAPLSYRSTSAAGGGGGGGAGASVFAESTRGGGLGRLVEADNEGQDDQSEPRQPTEGGGGGALAQHKEMMAQQQRLFRQHLSSAASAAGGGDGADGDAAGDNAIIGAVAGAGYVGGGGAAAAGQRGLLGRPLAAGAARPGGSGPPPQQQQQQQPLWGQPPPAARPSAAASAAPAPSGGAFAASAARSSPPQQQKPREEGLLIDLAETDDEDGGSGAASGPLRRGSDDDAVGAEEDEEDDILGGQL